MREGEKPLDFRPADENVTLTKRKNFFYNFIAIRLNNNWRFSMGDPEVLNQEFYI